MDLKNLQIPVNGTCAPEEDNLSPHLEHLCPTSSQNILKIQINVGVRCKASQTKGAKIWYAGH